MAFFLGIDNGGTKTDYVLGDEARELARVRTGTIKLMRTNAKAAQRNLEQALAQLTAVSGVAMQEVARTCVGTAGETVPLVTEWLRDSIQSRVAGEFLLLSDVEIALDAAFFGGPGVLVMAGTGSNVAGRSARGALRRAGGWGPALADQGSGHRIGHEALRRLFLARDEGRPTLLGESILDFWQLADLDSLVAHANTVPPPDFSSLAELTLRCAWQGDAVAAEVLCREGEDLGYLVRLVLRRVLADGEMLPEMAFTGSIMANVPPVRDALVKEVRREFPAIHALEGVVDPLAGALWRARGVSRQEEAGASV